MHKDKKIEILRKYYPIGDWDSIFKYIPNTNKAAIKGYANKHGIYRNKKNILSSRDITGNKYNMLTAINVNHKDKNIVYWKCKCDCGNETVVDIYSLVKGTVKSCGCLRHKTAVNVKDYTGMRFGMLTAVERLPHYRKGRTYYRCICDCGKTNVIVDSGNLHSGHTLSCGIKNHKRIEYKINKDLYDDKRRTYVVYRHIAPNGKSYIGITKQNAERRFQNGNGYKTQEVFWRAIQKYGWNNFRHEILEENLTEKEAGNKEDYYIKKVYKTLVPYGYNVAEGGNIMVSKVKPVIQYYKNYPVNFFEGITEASKKLKIAPVTIKAHIGEQNTIFDYYFEILKPIYRYDIPDKYYDLINESHYLLHDLIADEAHRATTLRNKSYSKKVNKYDLDGNYICTFNSITDARKSIERSSGGGICAAVNPNREGNTAYGYMWKYDNGDHSKIKPVQYKHKRAVLKINIKTGKVLNEYPSMASAARANHCSLNYISDVCYAKRKECKGFFWKIK